MLLCLYSFHYLAFLGYGEESPEMCQCLLTSCGYRISLSRSREHRRWFRKVGSGPPHTDVKLTDTLIH